MSANRVGPWMALILFVTVCLAKIIDAVFTCESTRNPAWFYSSVLEDRLNEDDIPDNCDEIAAGYSRYSSFFVGNDVLFKSKDAFTAMEICVGRSSDCSIECFPVQPAMLTTANSLHPSCPRLTDLYSGEGPSFAGTASLLTGQCNDGGGNVDSAWIPDEPRCILACTANTETDCWNTWRVHGIALGSYNSGGCGLKTWYNQIHTHGSGLSFANMGFGVSQYGGSSGKAIGKVGREMSFHDPSNAAKVAHDIFQIRLKYGECDPLPEFNFGEGYAEDEVNIYYGTSFNQTCSTGYSANDGGGVYTCPGGTFTGTVLECTADACDTTAINTGDKYSTNCESMKKTNDQCEQACAEGYESTQSVSEVYTCPEGSFEGTPLICEDVDECLSPNCLEMDYCVNEMGTYSCSCPPYYTGDNVNSRCELAICPMGYLIGEEGSTEPCVCHPAYSGCGWDADAQDYIIPISPATRPVVLLMGCFSTAALSWYIDTSGGV